MGKNFITMFVVATFILGSMVSAFAAAPVPTTPVVQSYNFNQPNQRKTIDNNSLRVKALRDKTMAYKALKNSVAGNTKAAAENAKVLRENNAAINSMSGQVGGLITSVDNNTDAVSSFGKTMGSIGYDVRAYIYRDSKNGGDQAYNNMLILIGIFVLLSVIIIIVVRASNKDSNTAQADVLVPVINNTRQTLDAVQRVETTSTSILEALNTGLAEMRTGFTELPTAVAKAVHTLDPSPFEYEEGGHKGAYQSPLEGINEGYYLELHVPANTTGDAASYDRHHEINRAIATRNFRKTMRQYHAGKFDAPECKVQKELIELLIKADVITTRKIS